MKKLHPATQNLVNAYGIDETLDLVKNSKRMGEQVLEERKAEGILCNEPIEEEIGFHQEQLEILYTLSSKRG